jgi:hypothetical protein
MICLLQPMVVSLFMSLQKRVLQASLSAMTSLVVLSGAVDSCQSTDMSMLVMVSRVKLLTVYLSVSRCSWIGVKSCKQCRTCYYIDSWHSLQCGHRMKLSLLILRSCTQLLRGPKGLHQRQCKNVLHRLHHVHV